eukprot:4789485-Prymnesium_polylepis.1
MRATGAQEPSPEPSTRRAAVAMGVDDTGAAGHGSPRLWEGSSRWFGGVYATWLGSHRYSIVAVGGAVAVGFAVLAARVAPPKGVLSPWPTWHNQARYVETELTMAGDLGRVDVRLFWGVQPLAKAAAEGSRVSRVDGFDVCAPQAQRHLVHLCRLLEQVKSCQPSATAVLSPHSARWASSQSAHSPHYPSPPPP